MHPIEVVQLNEIDAQRLIAPCISDWLALAHRMQRLSWAVLGDASSVTEQADASPAHLAAHYLCARLNDELRAVASLVSRGFVIAALSLDAGMLEYAFAVGWIGTHRDRGEKWLQWKDIKQTPFGKVRIAIEGTYKNGGKPYTQAQVDAEYMEYRNLCQIKHGNPAEARQFGVDMDERGRPERISDNELSPLFIYSSRRALWYAVRYTWLATCCYNDFHAARANHAVRATELRHLRIDVESTRNADVAVMLPSV